MGSSQPEGCSGDPKCHPNRSGAYAKLGIDRFLGVIS